MSVENISDEDFQKYIEACIENKFTIEMERDSSGYSAFNGEGYKLELTHYNNSDIMHIDLEAPIEAGEYTWPSSRVASLIPVPESNIGKIE